MNPDQNPSLAAAIAAARRLLIHAIDLRFDLDEIDEANHDGHGLDPGDLRRLRSAAAAVQREIENLANASPFAAGKPGEAFGIGEPESMASRAPGL